jgi:hypothetical protein
LLGHAAYRACAHKTLSPLLGEQQKTSARCEYFRF